MQKPFKKNYAKVIIMLSLTAALATCLTLFYTSQKTEIKSAIDSQIATYDSSRDKQLILDSFENDWYWLIPDGQDYEPTSILPEYGGKDQIKVVTENGKPIGYITYYMKNSTIGNIHFLNVKKENRGKGYAEKLVKTAIADLKNQGAKGIMLMTRTNNDAAQKLYKKLGFKPAPINEKYIDYYLIL